MGRGGAAGALMAGFCVIASVASCARHETTSVPPGGAAASRMADHESLRHVALPDLSRLPESVRRQMQERYSSLMKRVGGASTTNVDRAEAYGEVGKLFMAAEFMHAAEASLLNAQLLAPGDRRWPYFLGHLYRRQNDLIKAAAWFERALALQPADAAALLWLGAVYLDQDRAEAAEPLFITALAVQPGSAAASYGLGRAALARHDYARAIQYMEQALSHDQHASAIHYPLAMAYRGLGDVERAEAHLRQRGDEAATPADPLMEELDALLESAMAYQSRGIRALGRAQWPEAAAAFRRAIELGPETPSLRHRLGTALYMMGDARGAVQQFEAALMLSPGFAPANYSLGVTLASAARYREAIEHLAAAVRSDPHYTEARLALADLLRGTGRLEDALRHYETLITIDPRVADARLGHAMTFVRLTRYRQARESLAEAVKLYPYRTDFVQALVRLLAAAPDAKVRDGGLAMTLIQDLVKDPSSVELSETVAMTLAEVGQYAEAAARQREAIAAVSQSGQRARAARMADNLTLYESGMPCRTPWRAGELP